MKGAGRAPAVLGGVRVPEGLSARVPAEERGSGRDDVRLPVSRGTEVAHHAFRELTGLLWAGDVPVVKVNTSATLPAAVGGWVGAGPGSALAPVPASVSASVSASISGSRVVVHFSTERDDRRWAVELRSPLETGPRDRGAAGRRGPWWGRPAADGRRWRNRPGPAGTGCGGRG